MMKSRLLVVGLLAGLALTFGHLWFAASQNAPATSSIIHRLDARPAIAGPLSDSGPTSTPSSNLGSDEQPPANLLTDDVSVSALPTPIPGETLVYFIPSDNDATATVLFLYNTDDNAHIVALRGFSYNGVLVYSLNINVGANSFLRLASDSIASAPPPSWATPAPIITNFTDFTYFASLSLPKGVKAEGYVLFNPGTGVVNPRQDQGAIPLRFSTDPDTLFLPNIQNNN
ncbi:MAG: hypothetical protein KDI79_24350 [Anaerolineae bacterium]|nr:hypothetical protein [Anaerolineae bacterium]